MLESMSNLGQRATISTIVTLGVWTVIYFSHQMPILFVALIAVVVAGALLEFFHIANRIGNEPLLKSALVASSAYIVVVYLGTQQPIWRTLLPGILITFLAATSGYFLRCGRCPLRNVAITLLGVLYLPLPLSYLLEINYFFTAIDVQDGRCWLVYLLTVAKFADMGGYFFGKKFGRHFLAPTVSPKKTREGAFGGVLAAVLISGIFCAISTLWPEVWPMQLSLWQSLIFGLLIAIVSQFGDLIESLFKRDGAVKDSNTLPGLGGVLDIVDSLIFSAPLMYFLLKGIS